MQAEKFEPHPFNPKAATRRWSKDPAFKSAYDELADEFSALDKLLALRRDSGLTQSEIAARMGIAQASLARLESSLVSRKHLPSLSSLRKYAAAFGKRLEIRLI
jgi:DNA-binding XRE family transcriptional regulator